LLADIDGSCPTPASSSSASAPACSRQITEYEKLAELGVGGCGVVYKVAHKLSGEIFALKVVDKLKLRVEVEKHLAREVSTHKGVQHENIIRLHESFEDGHQLSLLLEFAPNGTLFARIRSQGRLPDEEAAQTFGCVLNALTYLHERGIAHRDVKPENVLMFPEGRAKLADFGWCAQVSTGMLDGRASKRQTFCGTTEYLSPEMLDRRSHDHRVDLWAAGVLIFEMLVGNAPFSCFKSILDVDYSLPDNLRREARVLIRGLLRGQPQDRLSARDALEHPWFKRPEPILLKEQPISMSKFLQSSRSEMSMPTSSPTSSRIKQGGILDSARSKGTRSSPRLDSARGPRPGFGGDWATAARLEFEAAERRMRCGISEEEQACSRESRNDRRGSDESGSLRGASSSSRSLTPSRTGVPKIGGLKTLEGLEPALNQADFQDRLYSQVAEAAGLQEHDMQNISHCATGISGDSCHFRADLKPFGQETAPAEFAHGQLRPDVTSSQSTSRSKFMLQSCLAPMATDWENDCSDRLDTSRCQPSPRLGTGSLRLREPPLQAKDLDRSLLSGRTWRDQSEYTAVRTWVRNDTPRRLAKELDSKLDTTATLLSLAKEMTAAESQIVRPHPKSLSRSVSDVQKYSIAQSSSAGWSVRSSNSDYGPPVPVIHSKVVGGRSYKYKSFGGRFDADADADAPTDIEDDVPSKLVVPKVLTQVESLSDEGF